MRFGMRPFLAACILCLAVPCISFADGSLKTVGGISVATLSGSPRDIGTQHAKLMADRIPQTEAAFNKLMPDMPGGVVGRWLIRQFVMIQVRRIEKYLNPDELEELKAMADQAPDGSGDYRDILYYHVLQDIGQNYACTGAAAAGSASKVGGPLAGRNFDLDNRSLLEPVKTVFFIRPDNKLAFASVAWPGMAGAVSGMNERGLALMVFSAKSENTRLTGVPVAFLARRVLEEAGDIGAAVEVIKNSRRMGPYIFLLADKKKVAGVEMDSKKVAVKETDDGCLPVANHYITKALAGDPKNEGQAKYSDSRQRYERMSRLLKATGKIGICEMLTLLRDKKAPDGAELAWGDPSAINNIKDAHSVIFDPAGLRFWVSTPPYAYGRFVGFKITGSGLEEIDPLAADTYPGSERGRDEISSDLLTVQAEGLVKSSKKKAAVCAEKALCVDKDNYIAALFLGDRSAKAEDFRTALKYYDAAVNAAPAGTISKAMSLAKRGDMLFELDELERATKDYEESLAMDCCNEANDESKKGLGRIARRTGEPEHMLAGAHGGGF